MKTIKLQVCGKAFRCSYKQLAFIMELAKQKDVELPDLGSDSQLQKHISKSLASEIIDSLKSNEQITFETI